MTLAMSFARLGAWALVFIIFVISAIVTVCLCKKKKLFKISIKVTCIVLAVFIICTLWMFSHGETNKYNDWWIVGNEITDVEKRYGEFDVGEYEEGYSGEVAYFLFEDSGGLMSYHSPLYYYMQYDEYGIVTHVYVGGSYGG